MRTAVFPAFLVALVCATAVGQDHPAPPSEPAWPEYQGVTPGTAHTPPRTRRIDNRGGRVLVVTWPGFQMRSDGASRFFVQTTGPVVVEERREEGRFVLLLKNARAHLENTFRPLETRFFETPVTRARIERRGRRDLALVLDLRGDVTPTVSTEADSSGYSFTFVAFGPGHWLPEAERPATQAPTLPPEEIERPPAMQPRP